MRLSSLHLIVTIALFGCAQKAQAQIYSILYNFGATNSTDANRSYGSLIQSGSNLYGYSIGGGTGAGTVFQYNLDTKTENVIDDFGTSGQTFEYAPIGTPLQSGSTLYGMTEGGIGHGSIFQYSLITNTYNVLHDFTESPTDGSLPYGSLIQSGSMLYGLTSMGAVVSPPPLRFTPGSGTIFQYDLATNTETVLHSFGASGDGATPYGSLVQSGSMLYGMTSAGGAAGDGTIFQYNLTTNTEQVLYSLNVNQGLFDGTLLLSGSILYGEAGNSIFEYDLSTNTEKQLYTFAGGPNDGSEALGSLIQSGSMLYGITFGGGAFGDGTIFGYNLATNTETVLHSFAGGPNDGQSAYLSLLESGSTLYGTTYLGGTNGGGVIFSLTVPEPASASLLALSSLALLARKKRPN